MREAGRKRQNTAGGEDGGGEEDGAGEEHGERPGAELFERLGRRGLRLRQHEDEGDGVIERMGEDAGPDGAGAEEEPAKQEADGEHAGEADGEDMGEGEESGGGDGGACESVAGGEAAKQDAAEDEFFGERRRDNEQEKGGDGRFGDAEIELGVEERKAHH